MSRLAFAAPVVLALVVAVVLLEGPVVVQHRDALPATDTAQPTEGMATAALPTSVGTIRAVLTDPGLTRTLSLPQRSALYPDVPTLAEAFPGFVSTGFNIGGVDQGQPSHFLPRRNRFIRISHS
mgnify:CR=1 FL=1